MTTQPASQGMHRQDAFWLRTIRQFLSERISARIKRLIFLSSVFGLVGNVNNPSKDTMSKLNTVLKLAHNNDAIAFPMYIHSWLWRNCDPNLKVQIDGETVSLADLLRNVTEATDMTWQGSQFKLLAEYLTQIAPQWIVYGPTQMIAKDLEVLFKKCTTFN